MKIWQQTSLTLCTICILCGDACASDGPTAMDVKNVLNMLHDKVDRRLRPVMNQSKPVNVSLTFHILTITGFDEVEQKLSCTGWLDISWKDEFMTWNESEYNGVKYVFPPSDTHWIPFLSVSNSYHEMNPLGQSVIITKAFSDGTMHWYPADSFVTVCTVDISKYPYDTQTCKLEFFPWGRASDEIMMEVGHGIVLYNYRKNGEWELVKADMESFLKFTGDGYVPFVFATFVIRRRPTFFVLNIILPVLLLSLLNILVFLLPAECGERVSYAITVLLAMAVFLSFISETMPKTAESMSLLSIYMTIMLVVSASSVAGSTLTLSVFHKDKRCPVPRWLSRFVAKHQVTPIEHEDRDGERDDSCLPRGTKRVESSWVEVSRFMDRVLFAACLLVVIPSTALLMIMIFVF